MSSPSLGSYFGDVLQLIGVTEQEGSSLQETWALPVSHSTFEEPTFAFHVPDTLLFAF